MTDAFNNFNGIQPFPSDATNRIHGEGVIGNTQPWMAQLPLLDTATFTSETDIAVSCVGFNWNVTATLVAINVGTMHGH